MRLNLLLSTVLFFFGCASLVGAWTKEDHEIFRLRDEVMAHEGANITFYDFIGVKPSASLDEINKAYRKKSRQLHPDKARQTFISSYALNKNNKSKSKSKSKSKGKKGVHVSKGPSQREIAAFSKQASERFARLGVVAGILRGPSRDRYDHFMRNGFPKWRGTGYYYARFRPGLISVLFGLFFFGGLVQYGALYLGWKRQRDFVERYIRHARRMAWGDDTGIVGLGNILTGGTAAAPPPPVESADDGGMLPMNRRQKRQMAKDDRKGKGAKAAKAARSSGISTPQEAELISGPRGTKKRVVAENGKVLIVDSVGNVFLEEESDEGEVHEYLLDPNEIEQPKISDTIICRVPIWLYHKSLGRLLNRNSPHGETSPTILTPPESDDEKEAAVLSSATGINPNTEAKKRKSKVTVK